MAQKSDSGEAPSPPGGGGGGLCIIVITPALAIEHLTHVCLGGGGGGGKGGGGWGAVVVTAPAILIDRRAQHPLRSHRVRFTMTLWAQHPCAAAVNPLYGMDLVGIRINQRMCSHQVWRAGAGGA